MTEEYLGSLENIMPTLESKSIRMIFVDFPFNTTNCSWDCPVNLEVFWKEAWRILLDNGVVIAKAQVPFNIILGASQLKQLKYEWIWEKTSATGHLNAKKMPMKAHENLMVFYKKPPIYNPQKTTGHTRKVSSAEHKRNSVKTEVYGQHELTSYDSTERYPRDVLAFPTDKQRLAIHSTQTPEALIEYFIKTYTNEGDVILDPCRGSNTTGVCADRLNRKAILIEKDEYFYKLGLIRREFPQLKTKQLLAKYDQL
jgi:DNA modification methylase